MDGGGEFPSTRPNFFEPCSHIALIYQSFCCRTIADRLFYNWIAEKNMDGQFNLNPLVLGGAFKENKVSLLTARSLPAHCYGKFEA